MVVRLFFVLFSLVLNVLQNVCFAVLTAGLYPNIARVDMPVMLNLKRNTQKKCFRTHHFVHEKNYEKHKAAKHDE